MIIVALTGVGLLISILVSPFFIGSVGITLTVFDYLISNHLK